MTMIGPAITETIQGYDLRTWTERIDPSKSRYAEDPVKGPALRKLIEIIDDDQFVWCSQSALIRQFESGCYWHQLCVDRRDVLWYVDSLHWCQILGYSKNYIPREEEEEIQAQAVASDEEFESALERITRRYLSENRSADPWRDVLKRDRTKKSDQLLVQFPFEHSQIVDVQLIPQK